MHQHEIDEMEEDTYDGMDPPTWKMLMGFELLSKDVYRRSQNEVALADVIGRVTHNVEGGCSCRAIEVGVPDGGGVTTIKCETIACEMRGLGLQCPEGCGMACVNQPLRNGCIPLQNFVIQNSRQHGFCVQCTRDIQEDSYVLPVFGVVRRDIEVTDCQADDLFAIDGTQFVLDTTEAAGLTKLMAQLPDPNLKPTTVFDGRTFGVLLVAKRSIPANTPLSLWKLGAEQPIQIPIMMLSCEEACPPVLVVEYDRHGIPLPPDIDQVRTVIQNANEYVEPSPSRPSTPHNICDSIGSQSGSPPHRRATSSGPSSIESPPHRRSISSGPSSGGSPPHRHATSSRPSSADPKTPVDRDMPRRGAPTTSCTSSTGVTTPQFPKTPRLIDAPRKLTRRPIVRPAAISEEEEEDEEGESCGGDGSEPVAGSSKGSSSGATKKGSKKRKVTSPAEAVKSKSATKRLATGARVVPADPRPLSQIAEIKRAFMIATTVDDKLIALARPKKAGSKVRGGREPYDTNYPFYCPYCSWTSFDFNPFQNHILSEHKQECKLECPAVKCPNENTYSSVSALNKHLDKKHSNKDKYRCPRCKQPLNDLQDAKNHRCNPPPPGRK